MCYDINSLLEKLSTTLILLFSLNITCQSNFINAFSILRIVVNVSL